jgi:hypothetical protein
MGAVTILRQLWQRRLVVSLGFVFALLVSTLMAYTVTPGIPPKFASRQYKVGIASAELLVDSPNSQVIDLGGKGPHVDVTSLSARAQLLGDLMATSPLKDRIARRAGIAPSLLIAIRPSATPSVEPSPLETGATVRTGDPRANILSVRVQEALPIIGADAQAPDPEVAARISNAAVQELQLYLKDAASADRVPDARKLVVEALGPARSLLVTRGSRGMFSVVVAVLLFGLWNVGVLLTAAFARSWKQVSEFDDEAPRPSAAPFAAVRPAAPVASTPAPHIDVLRLPEGPRSESPQQRSCVVNRTVSELSERPQPGRGMIA